MSAGNWNVRDFPPPVGNIAKRDLPSTAAFAAFVVMMMKVGYERSFNTCYPEADRIAILDINIDEEPSYFGCVLPRGFLDYVIGNTPGIECGSIYAKGIFDVAFCTDPDKSISNN